MATRSRAAHARTTQVAHGLAAATGEPVTVATRSIWPNARLPGLVRAVVRREGVALVVSLPKARVDYFPGRRAKERAERRRRAVHDALARLCDDLHVPYSGAFEPRYRSKSYSDVGDALHPSTEEHGKRAREDMPTILEAWRSLEGAEPRPQGSPRTPANG